MHAADCEPEPQCGGHAGIPKEIGKMVRNSPHCVKEKATHKEPLIPSKQSQYTWQRSAQISSCLMELRTYLILSDYFSCFPEVIKLTHTTSTRVILALKSVFHNMAFLKRFSVTTDHITHLRSFQLQQSTTSNTQPAALTFPKAMV